MRRAAKCLVPVADILERRESSRPAFERCSNKANRSALALGGFLLRMPRGLSAVDGRANRACLLRTAARSAQCSGRNPPRASAATDGARATG